MNSLLTTVPLNATARLCDASGHLDPAAIGWSSRPRLNYAIPGNLGRRKRWNHWCITTPQWTLSLTQADLDYVGYAAVFFLDLQTGQSHAHTQMRPFARHCNLPDTPHEGHSFEHPGLHLKVEEHPGRASLSCVVPSLGGQPLRVSLDITRPSHLQSANLVVPFAGKGFHACSRQVGLPCSGTVQLGEHSYSCNSGHSFAALDFGRGVWPFKSAWTRAVFAAPGGIAGNFGAGWTDGSGLSENALWFGGELQHLLQPVEITPSDNEQLGHWQLSSSDQRVALRFSPLKLQHIASRIGPLRADTRQWFGRFDGTLLAPNGELVPVVGALGWLGATQARW